MNKLIQAAKQRVESANPVSVVASGNVFGAKGEKLPPRWKSLLSKIEKLMKAAGVETRLRRGLRRNSKLHRERINQDPQRSQCAEVWWVQADRSLPREQGFKSYLLATANGKTVFSVHGWDRDQTVSIGIPRLEGTPRNADLPPESLLTGKAAFEEATGLKFKLVIGKNTGRLRLKAPIAHRRNHQEVLESLVKIGGKKKVTTVKGVPTPSMRLPEYGCRAVVALLYRGGGTTPPQMWIF